MGSIAKEIDRDKIKPLTLIQTTARKILHPVHDRIE